ncbi:alpha/beta hydrolase family protein [Actinomadura kijaniata]|uniref:alpha/beta hydrolase family protein n=1 Tax=Actinomadura kijaniata TaxID=46161 RepID=UPI000A04F536|nr:lipase family protein [Actinomadura kijaniata]
MNFSARRGLVVVLTAGLAAGAVGGLAAHADTAARTHAAVRADTRGEIVSSVRVKRMSAKQARAWLASDGFDARAVRYGVDAYRLVYRTVDARKRPTTASGLLVLPRNGDRSLRTVSYTHGTMSYKKDAPSVTKDVWGPGAAVTYGGAGFAAVAPDYLGLGKGPGAHPWMHVPSETTASLDMLRAARNFAPRTGRALERQVLVTGFSQGASAALGLARALQEGADPWFRVRAVAPISGAYDFGGTQLPATVGGRIPAKYAVVYASYLLTSWNRTHGLYRTPDEVFRPPYAGRVEKYFDGNTPGAEMFQGLPGTLTELLTPRGQEMLRAPGGRLAEALRQDAAAVMGWTPRVPVRLYKISDDEQAVTGNTDRLAAAFRARGVRAPVIDVGDRVYEESRHLGSNLTGTALTVRWFRTLR